MTKIILGLSLFVTFIGGSFAGSYSISISSSCFMSCKTSVKINGVERIFPGVRSAQVLANTGYLMLDEDKFVQWPEGEIINATQLQAECPTCIEVYNAKINVSSEVKELCDDNFMGSAESDCELVLSDLESLSGIEETIEGCGEVYMMDNEILSCLESVLNGDYTRTKVFECAENNTFSSEKRECLEK